MLDCGFLWVRKFLDWGNKFQDLNSSMNIIADLRNGLRVRRRWLPWFLVGLMLAVVSVCVVGYVGLRTVGSLVELGTTLEDELTNEQIEQLIEAKLPPSATNIHSYYTKFQDYYAQVRFDIAAADASTFIASAPFGDTWQTTDNPLSNDTERPWWQPQTAQRFQWATRQVGSGVETMLIDMTDGQRYIVYWMGFST